MPVVSNEYKHGIEYSHSETKDDKQNEIMEPVDETVNGEKELRMYYNILQNLPIWKIG